MRKQRSDILNKKGRVLKELKVDDYAKIYAPASHDEAVRRGRKAKRIYPFRGPLWIVEKPTASTVVLEDMTPAKRRFRRHISNIRRWLGPLPEPQAIQDLQSADYHGPPPPVGTEDIAVNGFIIASWEDGTTNDVALAKVTNIDDSEITIWCYGATCRNQINANFKPVYTSRRKKKVRKRGRKRKRDSQNKFQSADSTQNCSNDNDNDFTEFVHIGKPQCKASPFIWSIPINDAPVLVKATGININAAGCLTSDSKVKVRALSPKHIRRFR